MANAIIDQNFAKNWDITKKHWSENVRKHARLYPLRKEKQKPFVIVRLARNITLLISAKVLSFCVLARKGDWHQAKRRLTKMFKRGLTWPPNHPPGCASGNSPDLNLIENCGKCWKTKWQMNIHAAGFEIFLTMLAPKNASDSFLCSELLSKVLPQVSTI